MNIIYALSYYKQLEGHKQLIVEHYDSLEGLLCCVEEYCLNKDEFTIGRYLFDKVLNSAEILSAFSEEIGEEGYD